MSYKYSRYISRVTKHPWAITVDKLEAIRGLLLERAEGHKPSDEDIAERMGAVSDYRGPTPRADGTVAVIPIHGCIAHRADSFDASSGGTSTELIGRMLGRVVADASVGSVLLDFCSPGGSVEGVKELAKQIYDARGVKRIVAHVNALAASAGYWLASQCDEIVMTPSGMVGSVGVFMLHIDSSEAIAKAGHKITGISAGNYKLEGAAWQPLGDDTRAFLQGQVNVVYQDFLADIARGRRISLAVVQKSYDGRVYDAAEAMKRGMVDRIATMDETLTELVGGQGRSRSGSRAATGTLTDLMRSMEAQATTVAVDLAAAKSGCRICGQMSSNCGCTTRYEGGACPPDCPTCDPGCLCLAPADDTAAQAAVDAEHEAIQAVIGGRR